MNINCAPSAATSCAFRFKGMNYVRKTVALILSVAFCAAVIIGMCVAFAVKNVNVELIYYSDSEDCRRAYEQTVSNLNKIKGTNLLFLSEEDVCEKVGDESLISLESYEKIFPCTVNIVLKERVETFAAIASEGYSMYDDNGKFIRNSAVNLNVADGSPNVLLNVKTGEIKTAVELCSKFKKVFSSLRNVVISVETAQGLFEGTDTFTFELYSGLKIVLVDYAACPERKIECAFTVYNSLSESRKLTGVIRAFDTDGSASSVDAVYSE